MGTAWHKELLLECKHELWRTAAVRKAAIEWFTYLVFRCELKKINFSPHPCRTKNIICSKMLVKINALFAGAADKYFATDKRPIVLYDGK